MTELIKAASIARVTSKTDGKFLGWAVKSNSNTEYYEVHCMKIAGECVWSCSCKAGQMGFSGCKDGLCCHVKAVKEVSQARKEMAKAAPVAEPVTEPAIHPVLEAYALREYTVQRPVVVEAPEYRWCPPGYIKQVALSIDTPAFPRAKSASCKRAKQFENMPLNGDTGFSLLKVS